MLLAQSTLRGRVVDDSTKSPIPGVEVAIEGTSLEGITNGDGRFSVPGITNKAQFALLRKIGYRPVRFRLVAFGASDTIDVDVRMAPAALELAPIEVTVSAVPPGMDEFAERRALGFGSFIDWKIMRQSEHRRLSDVLSRVAGLKLMRAAGGKLVAVTARGSPAGEGMNSAFGGRCPMSVWLDGILIFEPMRDTGPRGPVNVDDYAITQLEAVEVYNAAQLPSRFRTAGSGCGALVLWTRRR